MPVIVPKELKPVVAEFLDKQKEFAASRRGKAEMRQVSSLAGSLRYGAGASLVDAETAAAATASIGWVTRLPDKLLDHAKRPVVDLAGLKPKEAMRAISDGLQVIALGAKALLAGAVKPPAQTTAAILHAAFGADKAASGIREGMVDPKFPWGAPFDPTTLPDISRLVREGSLREVISTFAECGYAARQERDWVGRIAAFGQVTRLTPDRACGGQTVQISFADFGAAPPDSATVADIIISLPTRGGCEHVSVTSIVRDFFDPARWARKGTIDVQLPADASTGCIGFFTVPPPMESTGPCTGGSLVNAAGMLQSILTDQFGRQGAMIGRAVFDLATKAEAGRHGSLPCASCQADNANHLNAGPPYISQFKVVETGPVHPRGTVTLQWSVGNADQVEIVARPIAGSENPHELPALPSPIPLEGLRLLTVPCTRRWEAEYVLRATNANGCATAPIEASVALKSGYSDYRIGVARADVTDRRRGLGMAGFAWKGQKTSGQVYKSPADNIEIPQFARAFVIEENRAGNRTRIALVVVDIWTCTLAVKREVVKRLNDMFHPAQFSEETVFIAGTHTHAGPGGYSEYFLYNLTIDGFDPIVFDTIVSGIVTAIVTANMAKVPGRIFANAGDLADCGGNRSFEALSRNAGFDLGRPELWTDREMLLLKFIADVDNKGHTRPLGALNWFGLHPTSLGMFNADVSGDNKGRAAFLFETEMASPPRGAPGFVAAFGNGCTGDVSGNVMLDAGGGKIVTKPLGGADVPPASLPPLVRSPTAAQEDDARMRAMAERQFTHAIALFDAATQEITGPIATGHFFQDMSSVSIIGQPGARTWPPALGISFGAGSSEDSIAYATVAFSATATLDVDANIIEGMRQAEAAAGAIEAIAILALMTPANSAALLAAIGSGTPISPALLGIVTQVVALMALDHARSFVASIVARVMFPGEVTDCPPRSAEGTWTWEPPPASSLTVEYEAGHGVKPIMFHLAGWSLTFAPNPGSTMPAGTRACPLVPQVLPMHLLRIGSVVLAGVPCEFTVTAGRRLKEQLRTAFGAGLTHVAVSNYTNGYSGYVTTPEEYDAQHYEGASTLFGPHTLAAYLQTFAMLTEVVLGRMPKPTSAPFTVPAVYVKP
jgi:neutral ceramidase